MNYFKNDIKYNKILNRNSNSSDKDFLSSKEIDNTKYELVITKLQQDGIHSIKYRSKSSDEMISRNNKLINSSINLIDKIKSSKLQSKQDTLNSTQNDIQTNIFNEKVDVSVDNIFPTVIEENLEFTPWKINVNKTNISHKIPSFFSNSKIMNKNNRINK